jgi:hypothetical protein
MSTPVSTGARIGSSLALLVVLATSVASPAVGQGAQPLREVAKLDDPSGLGENRFGFAVALSINGRTALVGARGDNSQGANSAGAAHVYRRTQGGWVQEAKIVAPQPLIGGFFGVSVALSADGNLALVGASAFFASCGEPICGGAAYLFHRDRQGEWHLIQTLTSPDGGSSDAFGMSVALSASGRGAAIGAQRAGCPLGDPCGAVFIFERQSGAWQLEDRLSPEIPDPFVGSFGTAVSLSLSGGTLLIGAENAAFIFRREGQAWMEQAKLQEPGSTFGRSVALSGNGRIALVGKEGAAFAYTLEQSGWSAGQLLPTGTLGVERPSDLPAGMLQRDNTATVAISRMGNRALVGALPLDGCPNIGNCIVLVLDRHADSWTLRQTLTSSDSGGDNSFGDAVTLSATGRVALIGGAFQACFSNPGVCNGAAYVFEAVRSR